MYHSFFHFATFVICFISNSTFITVNRIPQATVQIGSCTATMMNQAQQHRHESPFTSPMTPNDRRISSGTATAAALSELEMAWNPSQACIDLQRACQILTERGLKLSAKWAAEQWMGLPPEIIEDAGHSTVSSTVPDDLLFGVERNPALCYSRTLFELGEYAHAAAVLSETSLTNKSASVESMPPPLSDLTARAVYYRTYALYMAGERRKEENVLELQRHGTLWERALRAIRIPFLFCLTILRLSISISQQRGTKVRF